ncbi:ATP-binding protein [Mesorhizobium sp. KR9-304]|uniref:two-component system sensor histidine kinase NtrB n=1 Tax=Mesorhizobium sp. KR9-304 TaxID=3156614 RepID=UPI0032B31E95
MSRMAFSAVATLLALGIFLIDTLSPLEGAIAVLYVLVVLIASRTSRREDIIVAAIASIALTILAYAVSYDFNDVGSPALRAIVSLAAIGMATMLALQNQAATETLAGQARLLNLSHDMIFVRDATGVVTFWNDAAEQIYGWSAAEAKGQIADTLLGTQYPADRAAIEIELVENGRWEGTLVQRTRSGSRIVVDSRWAARRDRQGRMTGVLETHTDITERQAAQDAVQQAQAELAHAARVATLGELTASIAHEVSQPLMAIVTNGEAGMRWLRRDPPDLHEVESALGRVIAEGRRASDIVKRIRAFLKKAPSPQSELAVGTLVEEAIALVQREFMRANVQLRVDLQAGLPNVSGDRIQLQQVLVNLLVNASQAMADHPGERLLSVDASYSHDIGVEIMVRDTGPGIPEEHLRRLFDPFFTTKRDGMGMGLAICRTTAEAHGGRLSVESLPNHGATFRLALPAIEGGVLE